MIKGIKFLKKYYSAVNTDPSKSDLNLIMIMINELDKNCDVKLKKKLKSHPYGKILYQQKDLREEVLNRRFKKGTLGSELKKFWKENKEDLVKKNLDLSKTDRTKDMVYLRAILNEHDIIHCLNKLDSTPVAELSVLAFTIAKGFRWSFFYILVASFLVSIKNSFGKNAVKGTLWFRIKFNPAVSVLRLIIEAYRNGKKTPWFMTVNWHELLDKPIEKVRSELNIKDFPAWEEIKPHWYKLLNVYKLDKLNA